MNVTTVGYATDGWVTGYPNGQLVPATSTVNFDVSEYAIANSVVLGLGNGAACASIGTVDAVTGSTNVIVDVVGYE
jgi:hypothetical protein